MNKPSKMVVVKFGNILSEDLPCSFLYHVHERVPSKDRFKNCTQEAMTVFMQDYNKGTEYLYVTIECVISGTVGVDSVRWRRTNTGGEPIFEEIVEVLSEVKTKF